MRPDNLAVVPNLEPVVRARQQHHLLSDRAFNTAIRVKRGVGRRPKILTKSNIPSFFIVRQAEATLDRSMPDG